MAQLAIFIDQRDIFSDGGTASFFCTTAQAQNYAHYVGSQVLIGNVREPFAQGFIFLAKLDSFRFDGESPAAVVTEIRNFPIVAVFRQAIPAQPGAFEVSDATFHDVIGMVTGSEFDEAATAFWSGTSKSESN